MEGVLACLRGWHAGLAFAELEALLPNATLQLETSERWVRVTGAEEKERYGALDVASGLQCFLVDGCVASTTESTPERWLNEMEDYLKQHPVDGSVAVRAWKQGSKLTGWSLTNLAGRLGGLLHDSGCPIDLESPDHVLALISDGPSASLACGWMEGDGQASFSNGERRAGERPFFKPVSLDPMLARLAVNLAAGPLGRGPVVDPMTGTGGFLIEASLSGRPSLGIDVHSEMVQGAQANLVWAHGGEAPRMPAWYVATQPALRRFFPMDGTVPWLALCSTRPMDEIRTAPSLQTVSLKRACAAPEGSVIHREGLCLFCRFTPWRTTPRTPFLWTTPFRCCTAIGRRRFP